MARQLRIEYPGALYHVTVRGNNKEKVFLRDEDKEKYLSIMEKYKERYNFELFAYNMLDNHGHFLIRVADVPLSKIMKIIQQVYTQYQNWKYERTGHVFQQRYNAKLCLDDEYLLTLINYIHYNHIKAGLSESLDYRWSSHKNYLQPKKESLVDVEFILSLFSPYLDEAIKGYKEFMGELVTDEPLYPSDEEIDRRLILEGIGDHIITGSKSSKHDRDKLIHSGGDSELARPDFDFIPLSDLLNIVSREFEVDELFICNRVKAKKVVDARKAFIYLATQHSNVNYSGIAKYLSLSNAAITKTLDNFDDNLKNNANRIIDDYIR